MTQAQREFDAWVGAIRDRVDASLRVFFEAKCREAEALSHEAIALVREVRDLTMRGGKRLRPVVATATYEAVTQTPGVEVVTPLGAVLELLQTYLLIHDDWMDGDDERRGGPAAHFAFTAAYGDVHLGASLGILAGDLASTFSWELLLEVGFPAEQRDEACRCFVEIQKEVFAGQQLDLLADEAIERMHHLKTGSYTVRGPARLGALLGGATATQVEAIDRWARPLGVAFQLRDDLLSTFGAVEQMGKPGDDIRHGKHNAVIAAFRRLSPDAALVTAVDKAWGRAGATQAEVRAASDALIASGAQERVEKRLVELAGHARTALTESPFPEKDRARLAEVTRRLTRRDD